MKNNVILLIAIVTGMSLMMACAAKEAPPTVDLEQIKKDIQAKENEYADVYNRREIKAIGYYADDATTFVQNHAPLVGKEAIIEYLKANEDSTTIGHTISFTTNEVFPSSDGNQVVEIGSYKVVDGDSAVINTGNYMVLFVKRDGRYFSFRDMSACDMPLE